MLDTLEVLPFQIARSTNCIAGNFRGRKLNFTNPWNIKVRGENFRGFTTDWILCKVGHTHFCGENFRKFHQIRKIREIFLPRKFPTIRYVYTVYRFT